MHFFADCCFSSGVNSKKWWFVHSDPDGNSPPFRCSHRGENNGAASLRRGWEREGGQPAEEEAGGCLEVYFACSREPCGVSAILRHFLPRPLKITHRKTGWPAAAAHQLELGATGSGGWCSAQTGHLSDLLHAAVPTARLRRGGVLCCRSAPRALSPPTHSHKEPLFA